MRSSRFLKSIGLWIVCCVPFTASGSQSCAIYLDVGLPAAQTAEMHRKQAVYQEKAHALNPGLKVIDSVGLDVLKREKIVIGFAGYSGGKRFNEHATRLHLIAFLERLKPLRDKILLVSGGTNMGLPKLLYELGHAMGFQTVGLGSMRSGEYEPARMDYLISNGYEWGHESELFLEVSDLIFAAGGGDQTETEILTADAMKLPVLALVTEEIQGASAKYASQKGKRYSNGGDAGIEALRWIESLPFFQWSRKLPSETQFYSLESLRLVYPSEKIIGVVSWSVNGPSIDRTSSVRAFARSFLAQLNPKEHIIAVSGSHLPSSGETLFAEEAHTKGFKVIALASHAIANPTASFESRYIESIFPVARTWQGRTRGFINSIDALVSFGGRDGARGVVYQHVAAARKRRLPVAHMVGNFNDFDLAVAKDRYKNGAKAAKALLIGLHIQWIPILDDRAKMLLKETALPLNGLVEFDYLLEQQKTIKVQGRVQEISGLNLFLSVESDIHQYSAEGIVPESIRIIDPIIP